MRDLLLSSLVLGRFLRPAAGNDLLHRPLSERVAAGECSTAELEVDATFFPVENRTILQEAHPHFDLFYGPTFKVVVSKPAKEQYVLTQCGQSAPSESEVEAVAPLEAGYLRKNFTVPLQNYTAFRTEHYGFLNYLNVDDRVGHVISAVTEPCWQKALGCNTNKFSVDAVFRSATDDKANVVHIPIEQDLPPLKVAEYIKFFGPFFNKDAEANRLFEEVKAGYEAAGAGYSEQPTVAWIEYRGYANQFIVFDTLTKSNLVVAAGGKAFDASALEALPGFTKSAETIGFAYSVLVTDYADKAKAAAHFFDGLEQIGTGVDAVIDLTFEYKPFEYGLNSFLEAFSLESTSAYKFVASSRVLRVDGTIADTDSWASDWLESPFARPDLAAGGLARQLHSDDTKAFRYFRNIAKSEDPRLLTASMCEVKLPACGEGRPVNLPLLGGNKQAPTEAPTKAPEGSGISWMTIAAFLVGLALAGIVAGLFFVCRGGPAEGRGALDAELTPA